MKKRVASGGMYISDMEQVYSIDIHVHVHIRNGTSTQY